MTSRPTSDPTQPDAPTGCAVESELLEAEARPNIDAELQRAQERLDARERAAADTQQAVQRRFCPKHRQPLLGDSDICEGCHHELVAAARARDEEQRQAETARAAAARKQAELEKRLGAACIPKRYTERSFDTFPTTHQAGVQNCNILRSYANTWPKNRDEGISVMLVGGTGTGKSGLAAAVCNSIIRHHGATAVFMTAYGAVRHQRDTWGRKGRTERDALDDLVSPDLLVLDDVGASVGSDVEMTMLFEVINGRYADRKPTILTSNLPLQDYPLAGQTKPGLRTILGSRIVDRFSDDGSFVLNFDFPSIRGGR